jgi:hypothetical protein
MAESKKPKLSKPVANEGHTTARVKDPMEVAHRTVAETPVQRSRREYLFGSASVSPVVPSITEPSTSLGGDRTYRLGDPLKAGEAATGTQGARMRDQMLRIKTPAGLEGSKEKGDVGMFAGRSEQFLGVVAQADATRSRLEGMIRDTGSPIKSVKSRTRLPDQGMRGAPRTTSSVARESVVSRAPRTVQMPSGNSVPSTLNLVSGQGPVKANKQLVAEGNEEMREKEIKNRARRKDTGAKKSAPLRDRQNKQMKEAAKKRGSGTY